MKQSENSIINENQIKDFINFCTINSTETNFVKYIKFKNLYRLMFKGVIKNNVITKLYFLNNICEISFCMGTQNLVIDIYKKIDYEFN